MPNLTKQNRFNPVGSTFRARGNDKALAYLSDIMAADGGTDSGEDSLSVLNRKVDEAQLIGHGTNNIPATADAPWIHVRTDNNSFFIKERTGTQGSYSYFYQGPFFAGSYRVVLLFSTDTTPQNVSVSWNWENTTFNITAGGSNWSRNQNTADDKWMRIIELPGGSNTAKVSEPLRIGDPSAIDVSYTPPSGDGNISSSVDNVKEGLDAFHNYTPPAAPVTPTTGPGSLIQAQEFDDFDQFLSAPPNRERQNFSINTSLRNYRTNFNAPIFIEANARVEIQRAAAPNESIRLRFGVLTSGGRDTNIFHIETINADINGPVIRTFRISGNLPSSIPSDGILEVRVLTSGGATGGVIRFRLELRPDIKADEVVFDPADVTGNLHVSVNPITDLDDVVREVDGLPIQKAESGDFNWPAGPNGIDNDGVEVERTFTLHRLVSESNARPENHYSIRGQYTAQAIDLGTATEITPTIRLTSNSTTRTSNLFTHSENVTGTSITRTFAGSIPADATTITFGATNPTRTDGEDPRLIITAHGFTIQPGLDTSTFDGNLNADDVDSQALAQKVDNLVTSGSPAAVNVSVDNTQFDDPQTDPGGLRDQSLTITNAQEAFNVIDDLNQAFEDPFKVNQVLDFGGTFTNAGTINSGTALRTNDIDIDSDLRALSADVAVRVKIRVNAITNDFRGNISLIDGDNPSTRYGDLHPVNGSGVSSVQANDFIILQRIIPAAQVPTTVQVQWNRTSSTGSATFDRGKAYMVIFPAAQTGGQGQSVSVTEAFMWTAGPLANSRQTATGPYTILPGHTWPMYHILEFGFDNGTNAGMYKPMVVFSSTFQASGAYGTMDFTDFIGYNVKPVGTGDNQFEFVWGNRGIRHIKGFRIAIN